MPQTAAWCVACGEGRAASWVAGLNAAAQVQAWDGLVCDQHHVKLLCGSVTFPHVQGCPVEAPCLRHPLGHVWLMSAGTG